MNLVIFTFLATVGQQTSTQDLKQVLLLSQYGTRLSVLGTTCQQVLRMEAEFEGWQDFENSPDLASYVSFCAEGKALPLKNKRAAHAKVIVHVRRMWLLHQQFGGQTSKKCNLKELWIDSRKPKPEKECENVAQLKEALRSVDGGGATGLSAERGLLTGSLSLATAAAGVASFLEKRARQELELFARQQLLKHVCPGGARAEFEKYLANVCRVAGTNHEYLGWTTLREAFRADIKALPLRLAENYLNRQDRRGLQLAFEIIGLASENLEPKILVSRLLEHLVSDIGEVSPEKDADRDLVLTLTIIDTLAHVDRLDRIPGPALLGIANTIVEEARDACVACFPKPRTGNWSVKRVLRLVELIAHIRVSLRAISDPDLPEEQRSRQLIGLLGSYLRMVEVAILDSQSEAGVNSLRHFDQLERLMSAFVERNYGRIVATTTEIIFRNQLSNCADATRVRQVVADNMDKLTERVLGDHGNDKKLPETSKAYTELFDSVRKLSPESWNTGAIKVDELLKKLKEKLKADLQELDALDPEYAKKETIAERLREAIRGLSRMKKILEATGQAVEQAVGKTKSDSPSAIGLVEATQRAAALAEAAKTATTAFRSEDEYLSNAFSDSGVPELEKKIVSGALSLDGASNSARDLKKAINLLREAAGELVSRDQPCGPVRESVIRVLSFGAEILEAETEEDIEVAVEAFAAPVGSWRSKYKRDSDPEVLQTGIYLNGFVGLLLAGEHINSRPQLDPLFDADGGDSTGWHAKGGFSASLGLDLNLAVHKYLSAGLYIPIVDLTPFLSFSGAAQPDDVTPLAMLGLGGYARFGIGRGPFVLALGGTYHPQAYYVDNKKESAVRFGAALMVDVAILRIY